MVARRLSRRKVANWDQAIAWANQRTNRPRDFNPFVVPAPLTGVVPKSYKRPKMAMDEGGNFGVFSGQWAQSATLISQGYTFIGYPLLSELTQVPEYRVITECIATEMTRKWIKFKGQGEESSRATKIKSKKIKLIEDRLKALMLQQAAAKLVQIDGFFGRAHLYLDTGDNDTSSGRPLELTTSIGNGHDEESKAKINPTHPLKALRVIEPIWTYPCNYNANDPLRDDWYNPTTWFVMAKEIHVTRLIKCVMREVPDLLKPSYSFGGLSLSQMVMPYVNNWLRTRQSIADIIHAFSVMVLATDLVAQLQADGNGLEQRIQLFSNLRDNKGVMAVDKATEDFTNVSAPLGTLDALQAQTQEHMAAVSRIPLVKLLGITPTGLNASSEGEIRVFEDTIHAAQEYFLRDPIQRVIDFVQLSLWGKVDPDIVWDFEQLHTMDELQLATKQKTIMETHQIGIEAGVVAQLEARRSIANDPDTPYQGMDVEDLPENPAENMPENVEGKPINARKVIGKEDVDEEEKDDNEESDDDGEKDDEMFPPKKNKQPVKEAA